jgi:peptidyl-prolyl cis-trans isomerase C
MYAMTRKPILVAILATSIAASFAVGAAQAQTAAPKAAAAAAPASTGKALYTQPTFDAMLKQRLQQGQPDSPELRNAVREELNTRELLAREAKKANLDKNADIKTQRTWRRRRCWSARSSPTGSRRTRFPKPNCARNTM